jgi:lysophospholipase L1-like esterase
MNLLVFGDSVAAGCWDQEGGWVNRLQKDANTISVKSGYLQYDMIYNLSLSGDKSDLLKKRISHEIVSRVGYLGNDIGVIVAIGVNDSLYSHTQKSFWTPLEEFRQNIIELISVVHKFTQNSIVLGLTPADDSKVDPVPWVLDCSYKNEYIEQFDNVLKQTCEKNQITFIPLKEEFFKKDHTKLLEDGIHPNTAGHELIYTIVKSILIKKGML